jgi:hypothetical protein
MVFLRVPKRLTLLKNEHLPCLPKIRDKRLQVNT